MGNVISVAVLAVAVSFLTAGIASAARAIMSSEDIEYPPISVVLANNNRADLIASLCTAVKTKNGNAIEHIGRQLTDLGLDHITNAFIQAIMYV